MNFFQSLPPPPQLPPPPFAAVNDVTQSQLSNTILNPDVISATSSPPSSSSMIIITIVISSTIILSATIYLLLRFISRRLSPPPISVAPPPSSGECHLAHEKTRLDSLPLFKFGSVNEKLTGGGGDCAVCLSKFDSDDELRLLPLCCHVFHARCIDTWLRNNQTCPLCRSTVYSSALQNSRQNQNSNNINDGDSFRIEIGSISRRRQPPTTTTAALDDGGRGGRGRRSYSIGSFEYILNDDNFEVPMEVTSAEKDFIGDGGGVVAPPGESLGTTVSGGGRRRSYLIGAFEYILSDNNIEIPVEMTSAEKEFSGGVVAPPLGESLTAAEYGGSGRNWLKEYVERLSGGVGVVSQPPEESVAVAEYGGGSGRNWLMEYVERLGASSFRSSNYSIRGSGRVLTGGSRRNDVVVPVDEEDLEANSRVGEEISELFRWISGV
ncbi:ubiquitin-protein ligase [Lithospermum erythrorhizon]|uniref:RING-type E3 ubiquitin transferase n=1 Tax=Lithospermum erythrorhizon TaxID=34254 RepID=A0AAV3RU18_LITER